MENTIYELEGLSENPLEYEKNFDIIKKAINHCKANGFKVLKLPKGTFNIWNQKADDFDFVHQGLGIALEVSLVITKNTQNVVSYQNSFRKDITTKILHNRL